MKKSYLKHAGSFLLAFLFLTSCQKQEELADVKFGSPAAAVKTKNECRLVFATNTDPTNSQDFSFRYNNKALVDEWDIENYGLFKQTYDAGGKLVKSVHTIEGDVIFTIRFFYERDKVVKDIFYYGSSTEVMDETFYTYNSQGRMIRAESFMNDHVSITSYSADGNILSNELFFGGQPVYAQHFKYTAQLKNPFDALPGIDYNFPYYSPATPFYSKFRYASVRETVFDENGEPLSLFEYDPFKTQWTRGHQNYPLSATYFDVMGETLWPYFFEFENCGPQTNGRIANEVSRPIDTKSGQLHFPSFLKRSSVKSFKEQVTEWRTALKKVR